MKKLLEELENKHVKKCLQCEYKQHGDWCYMFEEAPTSPCPTFLISRSIREQIAINGLYKQFPDLER